MRWLGTYKNQSVYEISREDFIAMNRRERDVMYVVDQYVIMNDGVVGMYQDRVIKDAPAGLSMYDALGIERKSKAKAKVKPTPAQEPMVEPIAVAVATEEPVADSLV